jgi:hypothetical protein
LRVDHPAAEHHVNFLNFELAGISSFPVSPREPLPRGTPMGMIWQDEPKASA